MRLTTLHMHVTNVHDLFNRHACACLFMSGHINVFRLDVSLLPHCFGRWAAVAEPSRGWLKKKVLKLPPKSPASKASQTLHVFSRWTVPGLPRLATWPASLGWPSGPAGATLEAVEGHRACFIRRARVGGPGRRHAPARGQTTWSTALSGRDGHYQA